VPDQSGERQYDNQFSRRTNCQFAKTVGGNRLDRHAIGREREVRLVFLVDRGARIALFQVGVGQVRVDPAGDAAVGGGAAILSCGIGYRIAPSTYPA